MNLIRKSAGGSVVDLEATFPGLTTQLMGRMGYDVFTAGIIEPFAAYTQIDKD